MYHWIVSVSSADLLITGKTLRQSIVPLDAALKIPASDTGPDPIPGPNSHSAVIVESVEVNAAKAVLESKIRDANAVSPDVAAVVPVPSSIWLITAGVLPTRRAAICAKPSDTTRFLWIRSTRIFPFSSRSVIWRVP